MLKTQLLLGVLVIYLLATALTLVSAAETTDFTLQPSYEPYLINRCFLHPTEFRALAGSRIFIEGAVQPLTSTTSGQVELGPTTVTTGDARDVTRATTTATTESNNTQEPVSAPYDELIYGQLLDENGKPIGGVTVRINWFDDANKNRSFTTETLTIQEARLMGDPLFEGYYFFSSRRIGGAEYTVTRVDKPVIATGEQAAQEEVLSPGQEIAPRQQVIEKEPNVLLIALGQFMSAYWWWALIPLGIVLLIILWNWKLKKFVDTILLPAAPKAAQGARDLLKRHAKTFMQTTWARIDIDISAREATAILLGTDDGFAFVEKQGKLVGVLTLSDLLAALAKEDPEAVRIADLITGPTSIQLSTPFREASLIDARILPVMKNDKIEGYVRRFDILQLLDEYYSTHPSTARKLASARQLLSVPTPLMVKDSIKDAITVAVKEQTSIGVVTTKTDAGYRVMGVVPERLLVEELINFRGTIHQMNIDTVMERTRPLDAATPALEAARNLLESKHRALVITEHDLLRGVLTISVLVKEMRGALDKII